MYPIYKGKTIQEILELPDEQLLKDYKQMLMDLDKIKQFGHEQVIPINDTGLYLGFNSNGDWL